MLFDYSEVVKLENSQGKLKELCTKITNISKAVLTLWNQRNTELLYLRTEKSELENTVISLKGNFFFFNFTVSHPILFFILKF